MTVEAPTDLTERQRSRRDGSHNGTDGKPVPKTPIPRASIGRYKGKRIVIILHGGRHSTYQAFLDRFGSSGNSPALKKLTVAAFPEARKKMEAFLRDGRKDPVQEDHPHYFDKKPAKINLYLDPNDKDHRAIIRYMETLERPGARETGHLRQRFLRTLIDCGMRLPDLNELVRGITRPPRQPKPKA